MLHIRYTSFAPLLDSPSDRSDLLNFQLLCDVRRRRFSSFFKIDKCLNKDDSEMEMNVFTTGGDHAGMMLLSRIIDLILKILLRFRSFQKLGKFFHKIFICDLTVITFPGFFKNFEINSTLPSSVLNYHPTQQFLSTKFNLFCCYNFRAENFSFTDPIKIFPTRNSHSAAQPLSN